MHVHGVAAGMTTLPEEVEIVIVGGGVFGCAIAWRLASEGRAVLLLERKGIGTGASARAAGLITPVRTSAATVWMVGRTLAAITTLEREFGENPGFRQVGTLFVAATPERDAQLAAMLQMAERAGIGNSAITREEAESRLPWLSLAKAQRLALVPAGGFVDPYLLTQAYAKAARAAGACLVTGPDVTGLEVSGKRLTGVCTTAGAVRCAHCVVAAGAWSLPLLSSIGVSLGMAPVRSHFWITAQDHAFAPDQPVVLLPDAGTYTRPEIGSLVIGAHENAAPSFDARTLPHEAADVAVATEEDQWTGLIECREALRTFVPRLDELRMGHFIAGLSTYTADGKHLIGPAAGIAGLWVATGCCGTGISISGGVAEIVSDLVAGRAPAIDVAPYQLDRFGAVDPYDQAFRARCAAARLAKTRLGSH